MADFLLELLSEEIPARMQAKACADLARLFEAEMNARDEFVQENPEVFVTPRRLALISHNLQMETSGLHVELKGPRTSAPEQALDGFLRKNGLSREQLTERSGVWFAEIAKPGRPMTEVLAEVIPAIVRVFPWLKSMRWGEASLSTESPRWVRPLQGIVALFGNEVVDFEIAGIRSGAATVGHRFHHPGPITIGGAQDYVEKLRACHVILDPAERRRLIAEGAAKAAADAGLTLIEDEGLLQENAGLTEWPVALLGAFDPAFLDVPREVIQLTMRTNQKYFALTDANGSLAPNFVCVANIEASDGGEAIVAGNRKVLAARLADAKFFWAQDLKVSLVEQAKKLDQIVFHEKLGTVADKVQRVAKLARWLVDADIVKPTEPTPQAKVELYNNVFDAAMQCKADLVTGLVGEFPELQGVIGGHLARAQGQPDAVADAIRDHYKPGGQGDEVPTEPVTVAVSLADKLDTIASFFAIGERPTGSKDPYALRRAALGMIALILANHLRIHMFTVFYNAQLGVVETALEMAEALTGEAKEEVAFLRDLKAALVAGPRAAQRLKIDSSAADRLILAKENSLLASLKERYAKGPQAFIDETRDFLADRLKVQQREAGIRHDLIDAVFALGGEDDLIRLLARVKALQAFVETSEGANLLAGYKRAANILRAEEKRDGRTFEFIDGAVQALPEEKALAVASNKALFDAEAAIAAEDFSGAMAALSTLRAPVDAFFDKVTVNDSNPDVRAARLGMLARMRDAVHRVADFSRIEG